MNSTPQMTGQRIQPLFDRLKMAQINPSTTAKPIPTSVASTVTTSAFNKLGTISRASFQSNINLARRNPFPPICAVPDVSSQR